MRRFSAMQDLPRDSLLTALAYLYDGELHHCVNLRELSYAAAR
jgi:hypothetical protein